ncbi:hypothetical protein K456DRAFT_1172761 [Colletotrichum gloeosporioides 23]|nr:hypothetical protein K456DRAFT_1172761 [Colletotrichum gloeosporioides 23]
MRFMTLKQAAEKGFLTPEEAGGLDVDDDLTHRWNGTSSVTKVTPIMSTGNSVQNSYNCAEGLAPKRRRPWRHHTALDDLVIDMEEGSCHPTRPKETVRHADVSPADVIDGYGPNDTRTLDNHDAQPATSDGKDIIVVREQTSDAPNISLNLRHSRSKVAVWCVALFGATLQIGVLVFFAAITYHPGIKDRFKKDDENRIDGHVFPLAFTGTILLVVGLLLCAHVIEKSTKETIHTAKKGFKITMYWIQQGQTVSDQVFESFAAFTKTARSSIITSRQAKRSNLTPSQQDQTLETKTIIGVVLGLLGFITQFIGLRSMNAAASLAQLGAVAIMTVLRALVRLSLAQSSERAKLSKGFELDWLAWKLVCEKQSPTRENTTTMPTHQPEKKHQSLGSFTVVTGGNVTYRPLMPFGKTTPNQSSFRQLLTIRRDIRKLADLGGETFKEAMNLALAMEKVLNVLLPRRTERDDPDRLEWNPDGVYWRRDPLLQPEITPIRMGIEIYHDRTTWRVPTGDLEAVLSLWIYTIRANEALISDETIGDLSSSYDKHDHLRIGCDSSTGMRLFDAPNYLKGLRFLRDLRWWAPRVFQTASTTTELCDSENGKLDKVTYSRVVGYSLGFDSQKGSNLSHRCFRKRASPLKLLDRSYHGALGVQTQDSIEHLYSKDLLFSFISSVAATIQAPLDSHTESRGSSSSDWFYADMQPGTLWNEDIDALSSFLAQLGFGSEIEIACTIILPLSCKDLLPAPYPIFDSICATITKLRRIDDWVSIAKWYKEAVRSILGLYDIERPSIHYCSCFAAAIEYLAVTLAEIRRAVWEDAYLPGLTNLEMDAIRFFCRSGSIFGTRWSHPELDDALSCPRARHALTTLPWCSCLDSRVNYSKKLEWIK